MPEEATIPLLDHELAEDELAWMKAVYADFGKFRAAFSGRDEEFDPKEALREVLGREEYRLATQVDLSGPGPWRLGRNRHGRGVAAVFLPRVELHRHARSSTDQFPIYVVGEADAFSIGEDAQPVLTPVTGGDHFHNSPDAPHAFLPKVGKPSRELGDRLHRDHASQPPGGHAAVSDDSQGSLSARGRHGRTTGRVRLRTPQQTRRQEEPMDAIAEDTRLPADIDAQPLVQAAAALQPVLRAYHDEIEREQRLPPALVEQLHAAGFYRMVIPRALGGLQVDPLTYLRVVELLAEGAGSVGWNLANNSIGQLVTLGLPDEGVHEIYAPGHDTGHRRHRGAGRRAGGAGRGRLPRQRALDLRQRLPGELPGCWEASRSSTAASRAAARTAARSTGGACSRAPKRRSLREAGTWPGCAAPAASTGR